MNYAEAGDGVRIREELKRIVPEYQAQGAESLAHGGKREGPERKGRAQRAPVK